LGLCNHFSNLDCYARLIYIRRPLRADPAPPQQLVRSRVDGSRELYLAVLLEGGAGNLLEDCLQLGLGGQPSVDVEVDVDDNVGHGNQGNQEFYASSEKPFDRRNNVEQVVWPQVTGDSVQVLVKPYRMMLSDVPFAYAWKFSQE